jgi:hypothetical protein
LGYTKMAFLQETWENDDESILILILMLIYIYIIKCRGTIFSTNKTSWLEDPFSSAEHAQVCNKVSAAVGLWP